MFQPYTFDFFTSVLRISALQLCGIFHCYSRILVCTVVEGVFSRFHSHVYLCRSRPECFQTVLTCPLCRHHSFASSSTTCQTVLGPYNYTHLKSSLRAFVSGKISETQVQLQILQHKVLDAASQISLVWHSDCLFLLVGPTSIGRQYSTWTLSRFSSSSLSHESYWDMWIHTVSLWLTPGVELNYS